MENKFNHEDFEHFLKENADQYRMFPSEKVWKGIHKTIHSRPRWYGFGLSFLILTTSVVTWVMLSNSNRNRPVISSLPPISAQQTFKDEKEQPKIILAPSKPSNNNLGFVISNDKLQKDLFLNEEPATVTPDDYTAPAVIAFTEEPVATLIGSTGVLKTEAASNNEPITAKVPSTPKQSIASNTTTLIPVMEEKAGLPSITKPAPDDKNIAAVREDIQRNKVYDVPWTIESVINSYQFIRRSKRISLEVYLTPTITYRELKENKAFISWARNQTSGFTNATYSADIDNIVKHKPDIGLQLGVNTGIPLSKRVRLIGGIQFNVSKYDIRAYNTPAETATVSLSSAAGRMNTLSATSYYRNVGAAPQPNWLRNLYISASIPVGLEVKILGNRSNYFGISGTMQPTYSISNNSYLLTTDYKNYAKFPSLTRKINVNAGFEMFAGLTTGKLKWKLGPQVRYQVMSSYQDRYPIMEHLFDFGLKMGIMLNK